MWLQRSRFLRFSANLWDTCWKGGDETKPLIEELIGRSFVHLFHKRRN